MPNPSVPGQCNRAKSGPALPLRSDDISEPPARGMPMRPPLFILFFLPLAACSSLPTVPAPWEPTETQSSEPTQPAEAEAPGWTKIGSSVRGKPIEAVTLGNGPRHIYVIGGIHGDEPEGPAAARALPLSLLPD